MYNTVDIFNTTSGTRTTASLTTVRAWAAAASVNNKFMIGGGASGTGIPTNSVEIYTVLTGIEPVISKNHFSIFPNPVDDNATVKFINTIINGRLEVLNGLGQVVYQKELNAGIGSLNLDMNLFRKGVYIIKLTDGNNFVTEKFIKQ